MNKYLEIIQQPTDGSYSVTGSAYCFALFCLDYKILCKDSYAAITVFWACNNYRPSQIFYVSCKYSLSLDITHCLSQIFSLIRKYCLHLSQIFTVSRTIFATCQYWPCLLSLNVEILWQGVLPLAHEEAAFS